jgi:hypothetical protein
MAQAKPATTDLPSPQSHRTKTDAEPRLNSTRDVEVETAEEDSDNRDQRPDDERDECLQEQGRIFMEPILERKPTSKSSGAAHRTSQRYPNDHRLLHTHRRTPRSLRQCQLPPRHRQHPTRPNRSNHLTTPANFGPLAGLPTSPKEQDNSRSGTNRWVIQLQQSCNAPNGQLKAFPSS